MADHEPGKMDITEQEKTFNGFISMSTKGAIIVIALLIFLALIGA
ncbi:MULTISPECIES: aa3-type cytochrome c oxidase subunit IV [unclassified Yoonia]|nr:MULTISPECIES: aa3-type cytochrome c oxidase subunit IV [unclassified Yoonia]